MHDPTSREPFNPSFSLTLLIYIHVLLLCAHKNLKKHLE